MAPGAVQDEPEAFACLRVGSVGGVQQAGNEGCFHLPDSRGVLVASQDGRLLVETVPGAGQPVEMDAGRQGRTANVRVLTGLSQLSALVSNRPAAA